MRLSDLHGFGNIYNLVVGVEERSDLLFMECNDEKGQNLMFIKAGFDFGDNHGYLDNSLRLFVIFCNLLFMTMDTFLYIIGVVINI